MMMATVLVKQSETIEEQFQRLAELWHRETDHLSSMSEVSLPRNHRSWTGARSFLVT
jgi:hypothetical protein